MMKQEEEYKKEFISIHIGQTGINLGNSCWELYCLEHGIQPDGMRSTTEDEDDDDRDYRFRTFFSETSSGKFVPRALFIDLEPIGGKIIDECLDRIRKLVDDCSNLSGFVIFNAVSGGTGSGFCSLLLESLSTEYEPKEKIAFTVYPSPDDEFSPSILDSYNTILASYSLNEHSNVTLMFDNVSVYDICRRSLDIENPTYVNMNRLVSQAISSLTVSMRFEGSTFNQNLRSFCDSIIGFAGCSYVPVLSAAKEVQHKQHSFVELTNAALEPSSYMVKHDPCKGNYMNNLIVYRGDDVDFDDVDNAVSMARTRTGFDYFDTAYRSGINYVPVTVYPGGDLATVQREVCVVSCTTSIQDVFTRISHKFNQMYAKKDFLHSYFCEGMEEYEFSEAYEEIAIKLVKLCQVYENEDP
uniref:Tubulin alpha chain n=1 Tax=Solanum tuberosum TaxID=4113 RepID=M1CYW7_SOLTU